MCPNQSHSHGYWIIATARNCGKEHILPYLARLSIVLACFYFPATCVNAQCDCVKKLELDSVEIELSEGYECVSELDFVEIELSEGYECVCDCFAPCNAFKFSSKGVTPHFCYEAVDFLRDDARYIKVWLVDAISLDTIKVRDPDAKQAIKWFWKSKTDGEYLRVTEKWQYEPIESHDGYRLMWEVEGDNVYSEIFEIHR